jgi:hypothetical protein
MLDIAQAQMYYRGVLKLKKGGRMKKVTKIVTAAALVGMLGVVALPVASFAVTEDVDVTVQVATGLSLSAVTNYSANFGAAANATDSSLSSSDLTGAHEGGSAVASVTTNAAYSLSVASSSSTSASLVSGANTIPALATHGAGTPGYSIKVATSPGGALGDRQAVPVSGSPIALATAHAAPTNGTDSYGYAFASSIATTTVAGTYVGEVVFTATN